MASVLEIAVNTGKWDSGLKKAQSALDKFVTANGGLANALDKNSEKVTKFVRMMGNTTSQAKTAKGAMSDYSASIRKLTREFNTLSDAQKKGAVGQAYQESIEKLKRKFREAAQEANGLEKELRDLSSNTPKVGGGGNLFGSLLGDLGGKMGLSSELTGALTTGTLGMTAAITAGAAAVGAAAVAWADYNSELAKAQQITTVTTGLHGPDADEMILGIQALVDTYDVDFREAVNAANTLMTQFGVSGEGAVQLIRDGLQGMILGDGPKLLSMIQQYAPSFRDAGIEASQLVAIIHNSEGGLFTDENMNAIVMGIKNIRLMTDQTREALGKMGIDGEEMTRKLNDGTMSIFDALRQVATAIEGASSSSQAAGEVMQQVFGRQGVSAGTKLGEAIDSLNLNLDETKRQTGEVGEGYDQLVDANRELEQAMRDCFGYDGWQKLANGIETELIGALTFTIETINEAKKDLQSLWNMFDGGGGSGGSGKSAGGGSSYNGDVYVESVDSQGNVVKATHNGIDVTDQAQGVTIFGKNRSRRSGGGTSRRSGGSRSGRTGRTGSTATPKTEEQLNTEKINKLSQEYVKATDERRAAIEKEIAVLQARNEEIKKLKDAAQGKDNAAPEGSLKALSEELRGLQAARELLSDPIDIQVQDTLIKDVQEQIDRLNGKTVEVSLEAKEGYGIIDVINREISEQNDAVDYATLKNLLRFSIEKGLKDLDIDWSEYQQKLVEGMGVSDEAWQAVIDSINEKLKEKGLPTIVLDVKTGGITEVAKKATSAWQEAAQAVQSVGSAMQQIEDPSVKVLGIIGEAIANIALGFAQATAADSKLGVFGWIASIAGGIGTMISTIAAIKSATAGTYAEGGIIPGNSFSGDNMLAQVNSGELILNRAAQGNLASQLSGAALNNLSLTTTLRGEDIRIALSNNSRRHGYGEIVTSRR